MGYNRSDVLVIDKVKNTCYIGDFVIPIVHHHVKGKEEEKINKYKYLEADIKMKFRVKTVIVPIALGALGESPSKAIIIVEKMEKEDIIVTLQTTVIISNTKML